MVWTLEFWFSFVVPGFIWEFVEFLPCEFRIITKSSVLSDKSVDLIFVHKLKLIYYCNDIQDKI